MSMSVQRHDPAVHGGSTSCTMCVLPPQTITIARLQKLADHWLALSPKAYFGYCARTLQGLWDEDLASAERDLPATIEALDMDAGNE